MNSCYHCGNPIYHPVCFHSKSFCCQGCKTVYELFTAHGLTNYYQLEKKPGLKPTRGRYQYLKKESIVNQLLEFKETELHIILLSLPAIHCSSCIWILEKLPQLHSGILRATVNFPKKQLRLSYDPQKTTLFELVEFLASIGYAPTLSMNALAAVPKKQNRHLLYQLGVAGFAFGNIMFLSLPEYFTANEFWLDQYKYVFRWLIFFFSLPVLFFAGWDYLKGAYLSIKSKWITIDVPIALGMIALFIRSFLALLFDWGSGYFDSLSGFVFFLLLGKILQQKTYGALSFENDFQTFFPISANRIQKEKPVKNGASSKEEPVEVTQLKKGDRIAVYQEELIPFDANLHSDQALIDYSFITGESKLTQKKKGDKIFAGGRLKSGRITLEAESSCKKSQLIQLWSDDVFQKPKASFKTVIDGLSSYFTLTVLGIAFLAAAYWLWMDPTKVFEVFTAVLIVACPCAIALATPFTFGTIRGLLARQKIFIKNTTVLETTATH